jgi:hypothetical protein
MQLLLKIFFFADIKTVTSHKKYTTPRQNSPSGHCHNNQGSCGFFVGFNEGFDDTYSNYNP